MTKVMMVLVMVGCVVAGCAPTEPSPVGVGRGTDALKQSPCACLEGRATAPSADRLDRLEAWFGSAA